MDYEMKKIENAERKFMLRSVIYMKWRKTRYFIEK